MKQCVECGEPYNPFRTDIPKAGYGPRFNEEYRRRCRNSNLCDRCLIEHIRLDQEKSPTPQD